MAVRPINRIGSILLCSLALAVLPRDSADCPCHLFLTEHKSDEENTLRLPEITPPGFDSLNKPLLSIVNKAYQAPKLSAYGLPQNFANNENTSSTGEKKHIPLKNQTAGELWESWQRLTSHSELQQLPIVNALLAGRMRKNPDPAIYQNIRSLLTDPAFTFENKALLLDLLAEIATPEALRELFALSELDPESPLYPFVLQAISRIGDNRWEGRFHEELSPVLEAAWRNPEITDESLLNAIATALAEVGAPDGIEQLLQAIAGIGDYPGNSDIVRSRQPIAYSMSGKVHNPKSTKTLSGCLEKSMPDTPSAEFCIAALGGIDDAGATEVLLNHAENASEQEVRQISNAIEKIQNEDALKLIVEAPENRQFQNAAIEQAVIDIASDIAESSVLMLPPSDSGQVD